MECKYTWTLIYRIQQTKIILKNPLNNIIPVMETFNNIN